MASQSRLDELVESNRLLLESGKHSDFIVTCGNDTYNVHKAIICPRCDFFDGASRFGKASSVIEAENNAVELVDDDPEIVKHMMQYIYTLDYEVPVAENDYRTRLVLRRDGITDRAERKQACWLAERIPFLSRDYYERVLKVVRNYRVVGEAGIYVTDITNKPFRELVNLVEEAEKNGSLIEDAFPSDRQWLVHAKIYTIADKYNVRGLKECVVAKLRATDIDALASKWFWAALDVIYSTTPPQDLALRDMVADHIAVLFEHFEINDRIQEKFSKFPELAVRLVNHWYGGPDCNNKTQSNN
ncbi:hypothetical protein K491DRAFT_784088 [Lophiostoma macrostomum CBS 122681]|uniref:BTB domain-containing protein n=1 Tax=Lophiostoma macrostomum CBS 122681 TaxID=1314788 RepID=A0A6A6SP99_9PLEO|nr:hypothetical protein K491DRAFT_784088 [Lophiostoma macrostomum CBS 122681]